MTHVGHRNSTRCEHLFFPSGKRSRGWLEIGPSEDVFPIENGDFPACHVSLQEGR